MHMHCNWQEDQNLEQWHWTAPLPVQTDHQIMQPVAEFTELSQISHTMPNGLVETEVCKHIALIIRIQGHLDEILSHRTLNLNTKPRL